MRRLVDEGWAPSTAAVHVRGLDDGEIADLAKAAGVSEAPALSGPTRGLAAESLRRAFVDAASSLDEPAFERILDEMFALGSFEQVASELVMPALVELGQGWAEGRVDVAGEHAAAGAVQRRLGMAFMAAGAPLDGHGLVLVGMPPGGRHDLGALAFATALKRTGVPVRYLGADLPVQDWVEAVRRTQARAVAIGVVMRADVRSATEVAAAVRRENPAIVIALGGRRAAAVPALEAGSAVVLPDELPAAVAALRDALPAAV
jgi:methanogenic corrinoid protein MtbC1